MKAKGKIKFYDNKVNNFGFIKDVITETGESFTDVYFTCKGRFPLQSFCDNQEVVFEIVNKGERVNGINVSTYNSLSITQKFNYINLLTSREVYSLACDIMRERTDLSVQQKESIIRRIPETFTFMSMLDTINLVKYFNIDALNDKYFAYVGCQSDDYKYKVLACYPSMLSTIINSWRYDSNESTMLLLSYISEMKIVETIPTAFCDIFKRNINKFNYDTVFTFYSIFYNAKDIAYYLGVYSFNKTKDVELISHALYHKYNNDKIIEILLVLLKTISAPQINAFRVIMLFRILLVDLKVDGIKDKLNELLNKCELTNCGEINEMMILHLQISDRLDISDYIIRQYDKLSGTLTDSERLQLFPQCRKYLAKSIIMTWCGDNDYSNDKLISEILSCDEYITLKEQMRYVIDRLAHKSLGPIKYSDIIKYVTKYQDMDIFQAIIEKCFLRDESCLKYFLANANNQQCAELLKTCYAHTESGAIRHNIEILSFLVKTTYMPRKECIVEVVRNGNAYLQHLILKRIIYYYAIKKYDHHTANDLLLSAEWTDLGSLVIVNLLMDRPDTRPNVLKTLSQTFLKHIQLFTVNENYKDTYSSLLYIRNIVKKCNGRKLYGEKTKEWKGMKVVARGKYVTQDVLFKTIHNDYAHYGGENIACEGRYWKREKMFDSLTKKPFEENLYWCRGGVCYHRNDGCDIKLSSDLWSLEEIALVYHFDIDEMLKATIAGWSNRMNEILTNLKCRDCTEYMRPIPFDPKNLGFYATPIFNCINTKCSSFQKPVRLTHCINPRCRCLLDSRDLTLCSHGWMICNQCGDCCPQHTGRSFHSHIVEV